MGPETIVVLSGPSGRRKAVDVVCVALGAVFLVPIGFGMTMPLMRGPLTRATVVVGVAVGVVLAIAVVTLGVMGIRRRYGRPLAWLEGTVLHARVLNTYRGCDLATAWSVWIENRTARPRPRYNPVTKAVVAVPSPATPHLVAQDPGRSVAVALSGLGGRPAVPAAALTALADAILAGPVRPGRAGERAAGAVRTLREMAAAQGAPAPGHIG